jgi:superfamily II DNA or RNA helicase
MLIIRNGKHVGYTFIRWERYHKPSSDFLKGIPGPTWDSKQLGWHVPDELVDEVLKYNKCCRQDMRVTELSARSLLRHQFNERLTDYQYGDTQTALTKRAYFLQYDTGVGKTVTTIEVLRLGGVGRALIACPASVRDQWVEMFGEWWPAARTQIVESSDYSWYPDAQILIASYEAIYNQHKHHMVRGIPTAFVTAPLHAIVADESHYIKSGRSQKARALVESSKNNPHALKLCLSATPITNKVQDIWGQVNFLTPGRFGPFKRFALHYFNCEEEVHNDRAHLVIKDLKDEKVEELRKRLAWLSSYRSKGSIAHLLKGIESLECEWRMSTRGSSIGPNISHPSREDIEQHYRSTSEEKSAWVAETVLNGRSDQCLVFCYLQKTAEQIGELLQREGRNVYVAHGGLTKKKRIEAVDKAVADPRGVLVATMHSLGTGTNKLVVFARDTNFAEMYWTPGIVSQALGRVNRLNNEHRARVKLFGLLGTLDERMALALTTKLESELKVKDVGADQTMLDAALLKLGDTSNLAQELEISSDVDPFATMFDSL